MFRVNAIVAAGIAAVAAATVTIRVVTWTRATTELQHELHSVYANGALTTPFNATELIGLPEPVVRYFSFALEPGRRWVTGANLRFAGTFAAKPNVWSPFTSEQDVSTRPPGFVWDARITMMHVVPVRVRDSYVNGEGAMVGTAAALIRIVNQHGTPEMAEASLQRFLAEAVWYPMALLPRAGLSWSPLDDSTARVTIVDGATTASLDMKFNTRGEIVGLAGKRYRDSDGRPVLTLWIGSFSEYQANDGMMVPTVGEVAWMLPTGRVPYWRGRLINARFEP